MWTTAKLHLFRALRAGGVSAAVRNSVWRRRRLAILCYHGVSIADEHEAWPLLYVEPAVLRRRLQRLRSGGYTLVSLDEGVRRLADGTLPARSVALTFDDGTRDFAEVAVPLLCEFDAPATVYPSTYYAGRGQPVFDTALRYVLWRGRRANVSLDDLAGGVALPSLADEESRIVATDAIRRWAAAQRLDTDAKDQLLRSVGERVGLDYEAFLAAGLFQIMSAEEMRALPRSLIDVQLHTHRHRVPRDYALMAREITDNRAWLARSGVPSSGEHFCYPLGDYDERVARWVRQLGVRSATTCEPGMASPRSDPSALPRFLDHAAVDDDVFDAWVSGTAELIPRRRVRQMLRNHIEHVPDGSGRGEAVRGEAVARRPGDALGDPCPLPSIVESGR